MVGERATAHSDVAVPDLFLTEINIQAFFRFFDGRNGVSGTFSYASAAVETYIARVEYRVGLKLAVGKDKTKPYARTEFFGEKDF